jgi:L-threonylcarbamoyladenylate synthase
MPTETVYGLGADADSDAAVAQIFAAKGRPANHPLIVHVAAFDGGMSAVAHYAGKVPAFAQQLMSAFWPGPLTLILPRRVGVGSAAAGGQDSIGLRCPSHPQAQVLLAALRKPASQERVVWGIAAPSANRFGRISPTTAMHVASELGPDLMILDAGPCTLGIESTIVDCTRGGPVLLRPGSITSAQIEAACGRSLLSKEELLTQAGRAQTAPRASGTLESHYAPNAQVRLMDAPSLTAGMRMLGESMQGTASNPCLAVYARTALKSPHRSIVVRRMPAHADACAHELFSVLRELDATGVPLIWVQTPPDTIEWDGVRDRLQRAAAT